MAEESDATKPQSAKNEYVISDEKTSQLTMAYKQLLSTIFATSVGLIAVLVFAFFFGFQTTPSITVVVMISGALGAVFSSLIRLYNFQDLPIVLGRSELRGLKNVYMIFYSMSPIVV